MKVPSCPLRSIWAIASAFQNRGNPASALTAGDLHETTEFDPSNSTRLDPTVQWANFVKGVIYYLRDRGIRGDGIDCCFMGSIPMGAGLSSSAALEVATAYAVLEYAGASLGKTEIARIAQKA